MEVTLTKANGKVEMEKSFDYLCSTLRNGTYTLSIKRKTEPRTLSQNRLMWMWFTCLEASSGSSKEDWHDYYCDRFLADYVEIGGKVRRVVRRTSELTTKQFKDFLDKVQADAAVEEGVVLPLPEDQFFADFVDEYRLR